MAIDPNIEETQNRLNTAAAGGAPLSVTDQAGISGVTEAQYREAAQSDKNIGVNPDAIIGGILNQRSAVTTSAPAADKLEGYGADINNAEASLTGVSREEAEKSWAAAGNDATGWMQNPDGSWKPPAGYAGPPSPTTTTGTTTNGSGLNQTQEEAMRMGRQSIDEMYNAQEQDIRAQTNQALQQAETAQRGAVGAERAFFARSGAFMASTAALQYARATEEKYQQKVSQIRQAGLNALATARAAKSDADFKLLGKQMELVRQNVQDIQDAKEEQRKEIEFANKLRDYDKQDLAETFDALAADGVEELPDAYANAVDQQMGYTPGTSKGLFKIAKDLRGAKTAEMQMSLANDLQKVLKSVPVGTPIKIGDTTYYGTSGAGSIEMDDDGYARTVTVDQSTGAVTVKNLGQIGKPKDGWEFQEDAAGNPFFVNPRTQQIKPGYPEPAGWGDLLPDGTDLSSIIDPDDGGFFSGQCGEYARLVSGVRVGDTLKEKLALVDKSVSVENVTNGDCFIMDVGTNTGHIAVVSEIVNNPDGSKSIRFSDANWDGKGTIRNNQIIKSDDPRIKGFINGEPRGVFASGSDSIGWVGKNQVVDDAAETAAQIMAGTSSLRLKDLPADERKKVDAELSKLRQKALESGDIEGAMRASAGGEDPGETFRTAMSKGVSVVGQIQGLQGTLMKKGRTEAEDTVTGEKKRFDLNPFTGWFKTINPYDVDAQTVRAQLQSIIPNLARGIYGEVGVLTDQDIENYRKTLPNLSSTEAVRKSVLAMTTLNIQRSLENQLRINAETGNDVSAMIPTYMQVKRQADQMLSEIGYASLENDVAAAGYNYQAMKADGMTDDQIRTELGL